MHDNQLDEVDVYVYLAATEQWHDQFSSFITEPISRLYNR